MYSLRFTKKANKKIGKLDRAKKKAVRKACRMIAEDPESGKPLAANLKGYFSFRLGSYRIIYVVKKKKITVIIVTVGHRREVYDDLSRKEKWELNEGIRKRI